MSSAHGPIEGWSCAAVGEWLTELKFEQYVELFQENDISGEELLDLSHELLTELGVKSIGHRLKLLNAIKKLQPASVASPQAPGSLSSPPPTSPPSGSAGAAESAGAVGSAAIRFSDSDKHGYLTKQGANVKNWKRRYFVLKDMVLTYYKAPDAKEMINRIVIPSYAVEVGKVEGKKFYFQISHPNCRTYKFFAESEEERQAWIRAIRDMGLAIPQTAPVVRPQVKASGAPPVGGRAAPLNDEYDPNRPLILDPALGAPPMRHPAATSPKPPPPEPPKGSFERIAASRAPPPRPPTPPSDDDDSSGDSTLLDSGQGVVAEALSARVVAKPVVVEPSPASPRPAPPPPVPVRPPAQVAASGGLPVVPPRPAASLLKAPSAPDPRPKTPPPLPKEPAAPPPRTESEPGSSRGRGRAGAGGGAPPPVSRAGAGAGAGKARSVGPHRGGGVRGGAGAPAAGGRGSLSEGGSGVAGTRKSGLTGQQTVVLWMNAFLVKRGLAIKDPEQDLCDGVLLINLLEILSNKSIGEYHRVATTDAQRLENLQRAKDFMRELRVEVEWDINDVLHGRMMPILKLCLGINNAITRARRAQQRPK